MIRRALFVFTLVAALAVPMQTQAQVTGAFTVTGSSGSWFLNFAFTNLASADRVYAFVDQTAGLVVTGSPTGWGAGGCGGTWGTDPCEAAQIGAFGIAPGATLGGFTATSAVNDRPDTWFIVYVDTGEEFDPNGTFSEGFFNATRVSVPEPGSMMLLATGLFGLVGVRRRRRQDLTEDG